MVLNDITLISLVILALLLALKTTPSFDENFNSQIVFCDKKKNKICAFTSENVHFLFC